jgi:hypothetical protein
MIRRGTFFVLRVDMVRSHFYLVRPKTLTDKISTRSVQTAISWGAEEYGDGHH